MKFLEPTRKRKFIYTDISLEFGKTSSTPNKSPQNALVGPQRTQVTTCAVFSLEAISLIKEVERNDSLDEFISLRSTAGKIAPALSKIIQNSHLKKVSLEEQKAQKEDRFLRRRQIAFMIYDNFRVTGAHDTVLDCSDLFSVTLRDDDVREFETRWDGLYCLCWRSHVMTSRKVCTHWGYVSPRNSRTGLELNDMDMQQKRSMPNYQKLKTMVKRSVDQKIRLRNFYARHGRIELGAVIRSRQGSIGVDGGKVSVTSGKKKGQCSQGDKCSLRHENQDRAEKPEHTAATLSEPTVSRGRSCRGREKYPRQK